MAAGIDGMWAGETVCVLGAGASLDDVDPDFFAGKPTVGKGHVYRRFPCDLLVEKHHDRLPVITSECDIPTLAPRYDCGNTDGDRLEPSGQVRVFDHNNNRDDGPINFDGCTEPGWLVVSHSTITTALHAAARTGASDILVAGHDCGTVDGKAYFDGYRLPTDPRSTQADIDQSAGLLAGFEKQTVEVCGWLADAYGVRVYGLNPYVTLRMGGRRVA